MSKKQSFQAFHSHKVLDELSTKIFTGLFYLPKQEIACFHLSKKGIQLLLCWNEQKETNKPFFLKNQLLVLINEIQLSRSNKKPSPWTHYLPPGK